MAHYRGLVKYIIKTSVKQSKTQAPLDPDNLKGLLENTQHSTETTLHFLSFSWHPSILWETINTDMGRLRNILLTENSSRTTWILGSHLCQRRLHAHTHTYVEFWENAHLNADSNYLWRVELVAGTHGRTEILTFFLVFCIVWIFFSKQVLPAQFF